MEERVLWQTQSVDCFLELVAMGATVLPSDSPDGIGFQVGRHQYWVWAYDWAVADRERLRRLYYAGLIRFGFPGDFIVMPECLAGWPTRTRRVGGEGAIGTTGTEGTRTETAQRRSAGVCNREWPRMGANRKPRKGRRR